MLSTITVRSTLAGSRSTRIETAGLFGCVVAHAPRKIAMRGIINVFMQASLCEPKYCLRVRCPKVTELISLRDQLSYAFGSKDSRLGRRWRQGLGSVLHL